jgi:hypothetical protein
MPCGPQGSVAQEAGGGPAGPAPGPAWEPASPRAHPDVARNGRDADALNVQPAAGAPGPFSSARPGGAGGSTASGAAGEGCSTASGAVLAHKGIGSVMVVL